jgi:hypothetical protein
MADTVTVQGENTPEYVAYRLMERIFDVEDKSSGNLDRQEILTTYVQCIEAVRNGVYYSQVIEPS